MRFALILTLLAGWAVTGWHAVNVGTDHKMLLGAPQVEKIIHQARTSAEELREQFSFEVDTDGRNVRLSGPVNSAEERDSILAAAGQTRLLVGLEDGLAVLPTADPYLLTARKDSDGSIALSGNVPDRATREVLLAHARSVSKGAGVSDRLIMAAGVPQGDWAGMADTAMTVLSELREGEVSFEDTQAVVSGAVPGIDAGQRLMAAVDSADSKSEER